MSQESKFLQIRDSINSFGEFNLTIFTLMTEFP